MLEVIVEDSKAAKEAEKAGADRLEVVSAIKEGGLTPSYGTISEIVSAVSIPVMIMIRPNSHSFVYDKAAQRVIQKDIEMVKKLGATGIVFGALKESGTIDTDLLDLVIAWKENLDLTFHRAIDQAKEIDQSYQLLLENYHKEITQILTSGGADKAIHAMPRLKNWIQATKQTANNFEILVGSGVDTKTIVELQKNLKHTTYHVGSGARVNGDFRNGIDGEKVRELKRIIAI